jgi:hypothetical protein
MVVAIGLFGFLVGLMPSDFFLNQSDYDVPTSRNQFTVSYLTANNLTVYSQTFSTTLNYPDYYYNQSGLPDDHRVEVFWEDQGTALIPYPVLYFKHAFPGVLGNLWLDYAYLEVQEPYLTTMGEKSPEGQALEDLSLLDLPVSASIDKTQLLRLSNNGNSSYFIVSDGVVTQNFVVMNPGNYSSLETAYDAGILTILSSYEIDFELMKPNAFNLIAQLVTFQNPDFGIPGMFGEIITTGFSIAFWIVIAIIIYTVVTRLIPTIQGGIEN